MQLMQLLQLERADAADAAWIGDTYAFQTCFSFGTQFIIVWWLERKEYLTKFLKTGKYPLKYVCLVTFSAIEHQSDDAEFTENTNSNKCYF